MKKGQYNRLDGSMARWLDGSMARWLDGSMARIMFIQSVLAAPIDFNEEYNIENNLPCF